MKITDLVQTCEACPSQWEGRTVENRPVYIRFRWGYLSVRVGSPNMNMNDAVRGIEVYGEQISDDLDGIIRWSKVQERIENIDVLEVLKTKL